jgi:hypothetical protein
MLYGHAQGGRDGDEGNKKSPLNRRLSHTYKKKGNYAFF